MSRRYFLDRQQRQDIFDRFSEEMHRIYRTDAAFYDAYDIAKGTFEHWKQDLNMNLALIIEFCKTEHISLDYILRGLLPKGIPQKKKQ